MSNQPTRSAGCLQLVLFWLLALWFAPPLLIASLLVAQPIVASLLALAAQLAVYLPALALARRAEWSSLGGAAFGLAAASGYVAVHGLRAALLPDATPGAAAAELALTLGYVAMVVAPLYAVWRQVPFAAGLREVGLLRPVAARPLLVALVLAAPFAAPWAVVGALGSTAQLQVALVETLAITLGVELLLRGFVFSAYAERSTRRWPAIVWSALVGVLLFAGMGLTGPGLTPEESLDRLTLTAGALPAGLLLGAFQAGSGRYLPATILLTLLYNGAPVVLTDPRTSLEITFVLVGLASSAVAFVVAGLLALVGRGAARPRAAAQSIAPPAIAAGLLWGAVGGGYAWLGSPGIYEDGFVIVLREQADLSQLPQAGDRAARLRAAYERLTATAERSQAPLLAELDQLGVAYRPFYLVNMIRVDGRPDLAERFAGRPEVARIEPNPNVRPYRYRISSQLPGSSEPRGVEPNLADVGVVRAWDQGAFGQGVLVAGADTGYEWDHPALKLHYAGWDGAAASHDYHWHDAWDDAAAPFDADGHGTHTMGTIVGDDGGGNQVGLAPQARWIGCRNMRNGLGNPAAYTECMEFFFAPYPRGGNPFRDGDPARAPMVVNNSWGCPPAEGCRPDTLLLAVEQLRAAGIVMVVSAGNDGPDCATIDTAPALYDAVFSVGALQADNEATAADEGLEAASFSSRGPVAADTSGRVKPDISAPGESIRSSVPGGYAASDGTSMAGPHVAGLVALVFSANPSLIGDVAATEALIRDTAVPISAPAPACGSAAAPNNVFGYGKIDAGAAVQAALSQE